MTQSAVQPVLHRTLLDLGLDASDRRRLDAFLALGSEQLKAHWTVADRPPADAAIADADTANAVPRTAMPCLWLCRQAHGLGEEGDPATLPVPLQFDDLVRALRALELRLDQAGHPDTPPPASPPPMQVAAPPATPRAFDTLPARLSVGHRFRLRRWPNVAVLNAHPDGRRISPFVSSRALTLSELARLSGIPQARCSQFLAFLLVANFLHVEPLYGEVLGSPFAALNAPRPSPTNRAFAAPAASAPAPPPAQGKGLLSRLRQRLGLAVTTHSDRN